MAIPDFWNVEWNNKLNLKMLVEEFARYKQERIKILDELKNKKEVSHAFYDYAKTEITSAYIAALLLPYDKDHKKAFTYKSLPKWHIDTLYSKHSFFSKDTLLSQTSLYYRYCVNSYTNFLNVIRGEDKGSFPPHLNKEFNENHNIIFYYRRLNLGISILST